MNQKITVGDLVVGSIENSALFHDVTRKISDPKMDPTTPATQEQLDYIEHIMKIAIGNITKTRSFKDMLLSLKEALEVFETNSEEEF